MMVGAIDDRDLDGRTPQRPGGEQPAEPATDDHHAVRRNLLSGAGDTCHLAMRLTATGGDWIPAGPGSGSATTARCAKSALAGRACAHRRTDSERRRGAAHEARA